MDELHQSATGRTQHAHAQLKVFTFLFLECDQLPAKPLQCWLCRLCDVRRAASDLTVRNAARAVERKKGNSSLRRDSTERKEENGSKDATPVRRKEVHPVPCWCTNKERNEAPLMTQAARGKWRHSLLASPFKGEAYGGYQTGKSSAYLIPTKSTNRHTHEKA